MFRRPSCRSSSSSASSRASSVPDGLSTRPTDAMSSGRLVRTPTRTVFEGIGTMASGTSESAGDAWGQQSSDSMERVLLGWKGQRSENDQRSTIKRSAPSGSLLLPMALLLLRGSMEACPAAALACSLSLPMASISLFIDLRATRRSSNAFSTCKPQQSFQRGPGRTRGELKARMTGLRRAVDNTPVRAVASADDVIFSSIELWIDLAIETIL